MAIFDGEPAPWMARLDELAAWFDAHLVNRRDGWGEYYVHKGEVRTITAPAKERRGLEILSPQRILLHLADPSPSARIGFHTTSPANTCRWIAIDIDDHTSDGRYRVPNLLAATCWFSTLRAKGLHPLLFDTNGRGGFHLYVIFAHPLSSKVAHAFAKSIVAEFSQYGLEVAPEVFPKQPQLTAERIWGSWVRAPGKHHRFNHWMRAWSGDKWLMGNDVVDYILALPLSDPARLPAPSATAPMTPVVPAPLMTTGPQTISADVIGRRIAGYLASLENRAGGAGRNEQTFKGAAFICRDLGQREEIAFEHLKEWNARNSPPLDDQELRQVVSNAAKYGANDRGCRLNALPKPRAHDISLFGAQATEKLNECAAGKALLKQFSEGARDSFGILKNFLMSHGAQFQTSAGKIYFGHLKILYAPAHCLGLPRALELIQQLPEFAAQRDNTGRVKTTTLYALAKDMFGVAGRQLMAKLPVGTPDQADDAEVYLSAIVAFLVRPRTLVSTVAVVKSYAGWAQLLNPADDGWRQCHAHPLYAQRTKFCIEIGVVPEHLLVEISSLLKRFRTPDAAGRALLAHDLIARSTEGKGSIQIRCAGRRLRIWRLSQAIIQAACGTPDTVADVAQELFGGGQRA